MTGQHPNRPAPKSKRSSSAGIWERHRFASLRADVQKDAVAKNIYKIPGVLGIAVGMSLGPKGLSDRPVVRVYLNPSVHASDVNLPKELGGCEVVIAYRRTKLLACDGLHDAWVGVVRPGCNIGPDFTCGGTCGMKVWDTVWHGGPDHTIDDQPQFFLTANHVCPDEWSPVFQPPNDSGSYADNYVGQVYRAVPASASGGLYEVSVVARDAYRPFSPEPHAPIYPLEPEPSEALKFLSVAYLTVNGSITNEGQGMYLEIAPETEFDSPDGIFTLREHMVVVAENPADVISLPGNSGAVLFDTGFVPVAIITGSYDVTIGGTTWSGVAASFLNRADGIDVLAALGVSNIPPTPPPPAGEGHLDYSHAKW